MATVATLVLTGVSLHLALAWPGTDPYTPPTPPPSISPGTRIQLPVLNRIGNLTGSVETLISIQNAGQVATRVALVLWAGYSGFCEPQAPGPFKVECSGLLQPGSAWTWQTSQLPAATRSALVYSVTDCPAGVPGADFQASSPVPLAVEVLRLGAATQTGQVAVSGAYEGISEAMAGRYDPVYGGYSYYVPAVLSAAGGFNTWLYIQNSGTACTGVSLWFKTQDECYHAQIVSAGAVAPGETRVVDVSRAMPVGFSGSAWIRSSQPLGIVADQIGREVMLTFRGMPAELRYTFDDIPYFTAGSQVAFGPLIYREFQGWDSAVYVQNMDRVVRAKVKVSFFDHGGNFIRNLVDWVCPRDSQTFYLPAINDLPGQYAGTIRVESQDWFAPDEPPVKAPNIVAVAHLIKYEGPARTEALEGIAYNLFGEDEVFDWQVGEQPDLSVTRIMLPMLNRYGAGMTSEIAIENVVPVPGATDFAVYVYDQNGLVGLACGHLQREQTDYVNLETWAFIPSGFHGSAVISATRWNHPVYDANGQVVRNVVGLAAVRVERSGTTLGNDVPGDESAGSQGFPLVTGFHFLGPDVPQCPGQ
jgi:hypothetical protein